MPPSLDDDTKSFPGVQSSVEDLTAGLPAVISAPVDFIPGTPGEISTRKKEIPNFLEISSYIIYYVKKLLGGKFVA